MIDDIVPWLRTKGFQSIAGEIEKLRADLAAALERMSKLDFERTAAELERDAAIKERDEARAALQPMAEMDAPTKIGFAFDAWADDRIVFDIGKDRKITAGDLRRARRALAQPHSDGEG